MADATLVANLSMKCPSCGAFGALAGSGKAFEPRGRFADAPVYRCIACDGGVRVTNAGKASTSGRAKGTSIPVSQWAQMRAAYENPQAVQKRAASEKVVLAVQQQRKQPEAEGAAPDPLPERSESKPKRLDTEQSTVGDEVNKEIIASELRLLKALHDEGILTDDEYETKRKTLTDQL